MSFGRELVQRTLAVKVLHRGDAAGVDVGPQVAPPHQLVQRLGQLVIGIDPQLCGDVLRAQVHDEALLRPREGPEQAPVLLGVRNAEMGERLRDGSFALRLPLAARRPDRFVSHAYIVPYATDKTRRGRGSHGAVYVSNYGDSTATAAHPGEIVKITGLS
jgi:hypothetical protein